MFRTLRNEIITKIRQTKEQAILDAASPLFQILVVNIKLFLINTEPPYPTNRNQPHTHV